MPASLVIVNPQASRARAADARAALCSALDVTLAQRDGVRPTIIETTSPNEVGLLARQALADGVAAIVGVGGDGTMRDIASVLADTDVPLGIVPAGTGNQVAAVLHLPRRPLEAVAALAQARARPIDLGVVTTRPTAGTAEESTFIIGCGAGFDAELMATTSGPLKRRLGAVAYFVQGARLALRAQATPCRLRVDGEVVEMRVTTALIGNMGELMPGRLGLRLPLVPDDGLLDLIAVDASNLAYGARGLLDQLRRTGLGSDAGGRSLRLRGREVAIEPAEPMPLEIDGDYVGIGALEAGVRPGALRVLVPGG